MGYMAERGQIAGTPCFDVIARLQWDSPVPSNRPAERRRSSRLSLSEPCELIKPSEDSDTATQITTMIVDVSREGIGLTTSVPVSVGLRVAVRSRSGFAMGLVARCEEKDGAYVCGILFEPCVSTISTCKDLLRLARSSKSSI
jgi:hypothetical protein